MLRHFYKPEYYKTVLTVYTIKSHVGLCIITCELETYHGDIFSAERSFYLVIISLAIFVHANIIVQYYVVSRLYMKYIFKLHVVVYQLISQKDSRGFFFAVVLKCCKNILVKCSMTTLFLELGWMKFWSFL